MVISQGHWELRIDYMLSNKAKGYLSYHHCRVGPVSDDYRLIIISHRNFLLCFIPIPNLGSVSSHRSITTKNSQKAPSFKS